MTKGDIKIFNNRYSMGIHPPEWMPAISNQSTHSQADRLNVLDSKVQLAGTLFPWRKAQMS
jgi:hypothetical protein